MSRKRKLLAVTPMVDIPVEIRSAVMSAFGGTPVLCQICGQQCIVDPVISVGDWDVFYCIDCSSKAGLTIAEIVSQLVDGLSISYARFALLMEVLNAKPGTRRYQAFINKLIESGVVIRQQGSESRND